jgi:pimeloyl-ACP methyl ester carboxylesterase
MVRKWFAIALVLLSSMAQAQQVDYYLGHGIPFIPVGTNPGDSMKKIGGWLSETNSGKVDFASYNTWLDVQTQSYDLGNRVATGSNNPNAKVILMGHSMGGLRARSYLQSLSDYTNREKVRGLVTIDTPHHGAPLINGVPIFVGTTTGLYFVAFGGAFWDGLTSGNKVGNFLMMAAGGSLLDADIMPTGTSAQAVTAIAGSYFRGARDDLRPGSYLLKKLNTMTQDRTVQSCRWITQSYWVGWAWWARLETRWVQVCDQSVVKDVIAKPIANNVNVMSIVGTNHSLRSMIGKYAPGWGNTTLDVVGGVHLALGIVMFANWWNPWGYPAAGAHVALSGVWWGRDWVWYAVTGGTEGDAIVPKYSENMYTYGTAMGGNYGWAGSSPQDSVKEIPILHTQQDDATQVKNALRFYQNRTGLPPVNQ